MVTKAQSAIQQQKHLWRRDTERYKGDLHCNEHRKRKHRWCREQTPQAFSWDGDDPKPTLTRNSGRRFSYAQHVMERTYGLLILY
ncbi:hypothetical protein IHE45_05G173000 [Dioscorea alata]|nr:hypothetical protein IHE45_05G173000 [Dioscorea alata]